MATTKKFEELECWKISRILVVEIFGLCKQEECKYEFEIKNQIKRALQSIMNNTAEGFDRNTNKEFIRYLSISLSSSSEVKSMLYVISDLKLIGTTQINKINALIDDCQKLIKGLIKYLNGKI